jgi:hypoxanthine phosphoribosyltransferase
MMQQILDQKFDIFITADQIMKRIDEMARQVNLDYQGKNPLFLSILNGAFIFTADFIRAIEIPSEVSFIKLKSYLSGSFHFSVRLELDE